MSFTLPLRGADGVRSRMAEIQARLEAAFPSAPRAGQSGLAGEIGPGTAPLNPFGPGLSVQGRTAPSSLLPSIESAARSAGVDPALLDALVAAESSYDPSARSSAGAMGLTQLMPATAKELGVADPFDPVQNLQGGATYLARMLQRFGGDERLALAAYNAGPGAVDKFSGVPPYAQTKAYVERVLALAAERRGR